MPDRAGPGTRPFCRATDRVALYIYTYEQVSVQDTSSLEELAKEVADLIEEQHAYLHGAIGDGSQNRRKIGGSIGRIGYLWRNKSAYVQTMDFVSFSWLRKDI
jgi:hypothetical protein